MCDILVMVVCSHITVGLTNADFICGKVEDTLSSLTIKRSTPGSQATEAATIAIADPPRGGLRELLKHRT